MRGGSRADRRHRVQPLDGGLQVRIGHEATANTPPPNHGTLVRENRTSYHLSMTSSCNTAAHRLDKDQWLFRCCRATEELIMRTGTSYFFRIVALLLLATGIHLAGCSRSDEVDAWKGKTQVAEERAKAAETALAQTKSEKADLQAQVMKLATEANERAAAKSRVPMDTGTPSHPLEADATGGLGWGWCGEAGGNPWGIPWRLLQVSPSESLHRYHDLARCHPIKAVCEWLGNSSLIASKHYLQVTESDFERATQAVNPTPSNLPQIPPQQTDASEGIDEKAKKSHTS
jgi:hypothetical protein